MLSNIGDNSQSNQMSRHADRPGVSTALAVATVAGLWLLARPYIGVRHDGVLYMGQTLLQLHGDILSKDLFFAYGSQDRFSVFSSLVARLYATLGMERTQFLLLCAGLTSLMAAAATLLRSLPDPRERWLGLATVAVMSHVYGGNAIFAFAESFVTARTLAEPLALAALVALLAGRTAWAVALAAGAALAHPLVTLPVIVIGWQVLCVRNRRWWWAIATLLGGLALAVAGVAPFSGLLQRFDATWMGAVADASPHVFVSRWLLLDWQRAVVDVGLVALGARLLSQPLAGLYRATWTSSVALTALSVVGADVAHNVLISQLQLWRVLWVCHLLALLALPALWLRAWVLGREGRDCALGLAAMAIAVYSDWQTGWAFVLWALLLGIRLLRRPPIAASLERAIPIVNAALLAGLTVVAATQMHSRLLALGLTLETGTALWMAAATPVVALTLAAWLLAKRKGVQGSIAAALSLMLLIVGVVHWDQRSAQTRAMERMGFGNHPFSRYIPPDAQVFWPEQLVAVWGALGRASYLTDAQRAGLLFNRATAIEYLRRNPAVAPFALQQEVCRFVSTAMGADADTESCAPDVQLIDEMCQYSKGPDFFIVKFQLPRQAISEWHAPGDGSRSITYYLYDCAQFR